MSASPSAQASAPSPESAIAPAGLARAAFAYRDFRLFQAARFLAVMAIQMQSVAVGWQVYATTHRAMDLGLVGLVQFLPNIGLTLVAGHTADRFDRRRILLLCHGGLCVCALLLVFLAERPPSGLVPLFSVLALIGTLRAFVGPTNQALLPELVPIEHFGNAVAWGSSVFEVATIAGPAAGGALYGLLGGPGGVYACAAAFYLSAVLLEFAIGIRTGRMEKAPPSWATVLAGVRYVWAQKLILGAISLDLFAMLLGGAVALLPVYAKDILHVGPTGLGALRSAPAVGATIMAIVLAYRPLKRRAGHVLFVCVALFGVATIFFGLSRSFPLSLAALVVIGAADMVSVVIRLTLVQVATPAAMRGRVAAVNMMFVGASNELGEFESGLSAAWLGTVPAVVLGGVGTLLVVGLWSWLFPALRRANRLDGTP